MLDSGLETRLQQYVREHEQLMEDLRLVSSLSLSQCYIAAGYIRNYVWDRLHGYEYRAKHEDIDVVYFDSYELSEQRDKEIENELIAHTGNEQWSVKNQARMHVKNGMEPYQSTADALSRWPEVVTAIGVRINDREQIECCHPHGLDDLFNLVVRRSPLFHDRAYYLERVRKKNWKQQWPMLTIMEN
ncbi:nucleotidyltransferase family protein [Paenibacillus sp. 481]|uniref:nucleotidyltransferase family protein n=1 Tax=Paenibacillus sp. 481 TaxID=2835869 RepID=UPI001E6551F4|nr:nucleotidyltransferase family protein [Paenibacillus sp. 481]UHA73717.1 nucleotidyltransferase family protein [Paenibacillus sp. 481]